MRAVLPLIALLYACESTSTETPEAPAAEVAEVGTEAEPTEPEAVAAAGDEAGDEATNDGPTTYGEALSDRELVSLATLAAAPDQYAGEVVKTEGEIAAVCQRMGCWMEMRAEGVDPVRVPMAGHSFFLPKDVSGRRATVEGEVAVRELPEAEREHLESEGALATAQTLQISATSVVIR